MALSEFEIKRTEVLTEKFIETRRPPADLRDQIDFAFRIIDQSLEIFEIRPAWDDPTKQTERSITKATYVKSKKVWNIFWMRADLKWHRYAPCPEVKYIEDFLTLVDQDELQCFWG